jgi:hypothetical protein
MKLTEAEVRRLEPLEKVTKLTRLQLALRAQRRFSLFVSYSLIVSSTEVEARTIYE